MFVMVVCVCYCIDSVGCTVAGRTQIREGISNQCGFREGISYRRGCRDAIVFLLIECVVVSRWFVFFVLFILVYVMA